MLFSEVHSAYYRAVSKILTEALNGPVNPARMDEIVRQEAFSESVLAVGPALRSGEWPLLTADGGTTLRFAPSMPLTTLEKRWLKALLLDPRIALFDPPSDGLGDVEPLFDPEDVYWFDRYLDGDPYGDPAYAERFQTVLRALREGRKLRIAFMGKRGHRMQGLFIPERLEYSQKDDKFRLRTLGGRRLSIRISSI
ncbi:MAG TPA: WYL domain-containing protein, partial [Clostridia bacterium]|nr:WYL domain-containing protein [Clostridia bacterium]